MIFLEKLEYPWKKWYANILFKKKMTAHLKIMKHVCFRCLRSLLSFSSQGDKENVLTLWKMDPHQARMSFAQAVDNSLIPGKPVYSICCLKALVISYLACLIKE